MINRRVVAEVGSVNEAEVVHTTEAVHTADSRTLMTNRIAQIIYLMTSIATVLILGRFALLMTGAHSGNAFYSFMMAASRPLMLPFLSLFGDTPSVGHGYFEWTALVAVLVYWIAAAILVRIFEVAINPRNADVAYTRHRAAAVAAPTTTIVR